MQKQLLDTPEQIVKFLSQHQNSLQWLFFGRGLKFNKDSIDIKVIDKNKEHQIYSPSPNYKYRMVSRTVHDGGYEIIHNNQKFMIWYGDDLHYTLENLFYLQEKRCPLVMIILVLMMAGIGAGLIYKYGLLEKAEKPKTHQEQPSEKTIVNPVGVIAYDKLQNVM